MNGNDEPEWLRPIDPLVDSYAPEQIESELEPRHALYLREAKRLVIEGLVPDESGLEGRDPRRDAQVPEVAPMVREPRARTGRGRRRGQATSPR